MATKSSNRTGNDFGFINVAVGRFSAIGDVTMSIPVVYSACRCYPDVRFIMVTRRSMQNIFVNPPENLTVVGVDLKDDYKGIPGMRRLASELKKGYRVDAFIDLHDVIRTRILGFFLKSKGVKIFRLHKGRANKKALTRRRNKVMLPLISSRARYREAFFNAGLPLSERFDGLYFGRNAAPVSLFAEITKPKNYGEVWVGIAPFAAHKGKIYPPEKMEQVLSRLILSRPDVKVFLFGGGEEETRLLDEWASRYPRVQSNAGKRYGFAAELALLNHIDTLVTMDSANMHLASVAGTPTLSVWGATHPYCGFKGWRQPDTNTVSLNMTCRPCSVFGEKPCFRGDYLCLTAITPEMIYNRLINMLPEPKK